MGIPGTPNSRRNIRIAQIVRYRATGRLQDKQIADLVGMTPQGLAYILKSPEYQAEEEAYLEGRLTKMDEELAGDLDALRNSFKVAVPAAARTLIETVTQRRDLRAAMAAAKEILDRDPDRTFVAQRSVTAPGSGDGASGPFNPGQAGSVLPQINATAEKVIVEINQAAAPKASEANG